MKLSKFETLKFNCMLVEIIAKMNEMDGDDSIFVDHHELDLFIKELQELKKIC